MNKVIKGAQTGRLICSKPNFKKLETGRISYGNPRLKDIAANIEDILNTPKGEVLLAKDYDQIRPVIRYSK